MDIVLDSYSVIAFFENEPGADQVSELLKRANEKEKPLFLSVINWGEVYYISFRNGGKSSAEEAMRNIQSLPIEIIPADMELTRIAAEFKAGCRMSYADTFAAALTKQRKGQLVTGDEEFKQIEDRIKILWL